MKRQRKRPVYCDGKVHVCASLCKTCIFKPGNRMMLAPGRVEGMIESADRDDTTIVCHSTLGKDEAACRGYFERRSSATLRLAEACGMVVFQEVNKEQGM